MDIDRRKRRLRRLVVEIVVVLLALAVVTVVVMRNDTDLGSNPELAEELLAMEREDNEARRAQIDVGLVHAGEEPTKEQLAAVDRVERVDRRNAARLEEIVDEFGWPGRSLVGEAAASAAWQIVQHAVHDRAFQKRALELMRKAGPDEVDPKHVAYLTDRDRIYDERKQVYGTQFHCVDGRHEPHPIEDPENVDDRRKSVGIGTLDEQRERELEVYGPCPKGEG